ncbi:MAG: HdeD family acid-resistance protein [Leptolyngbyaceae bacterium]|nr:HdeD family acid-resistance protein [Leptolyngbyaceae bacterium]
MRLETEDRTLQEELQRGYRWAVALGILMIILGVLAIAAPFYATLIATLVFGWVLIVSGIVQMIYSFQTRKAGNFFLKFLVSLLYLGAGIFILQSPVIGAISLTLVLGIAILVSGVIQTIMAFQMRSSPNWGWVLASGIVSIILGILIWNRWPFSAAWVIGLLVGVTLLFNGWWIILVSTSARSLLRGRS